MERRTFLKAAVVAGSTPAAAWAPARPLTLSTLIADREVAIALDDQAWGRVCEIDDSEAMQNLPELRVQISRHAAGYDADGGRVFEPTYAHNVFEVEQFAETCMNVEMLFVSDEAGRQRVTSKFERAVSEKVEELQVIKDERERIEDACGYTAALEHARTTAARVRAIEQVILDLVPCSLEEAARKCRWVVNAFKSCRGYLCDRDDIAEVALAAIGRATS